MDYQILNGAVCFSNGDKNVLYLDLLSDNTLHIYRDPSHVSPVIGQVRLPCRYALEKEADGYLFKTSRFVIRIAPSLSLSGLTLEGKDLFEETEPIPSPRRGESDLSLAKAEGQSVRAEEEYPTSHTFTLHEDERFYGLGDHMSPLDKREYRFINYNSDYPQVHVEDVPSLYKDFPFFLVKRGSLSFGFYVDNTYKKRFDFGTDQKTYSFAIHKGADDFYFLFGPSPKDVVSEFARLSGHCPLPLRWSLGNQQSRWSYANEEQVNAVVEGYKKADIPLEAIHLDIDYMEGYRIFTISKERFPDFPSFVLSLKEKGIKVVTIVDPGIKVDPDYSIDQEWLCRDPRGQNLRECGLAGRQRLSRLQRTQSPRVVEREDPSLHEREPSGGDLVR